MCENSRDRAVVKCMGLERAGTRVINADHILFRSSFCDPAEFLAETQTDFQDWITRIPLISWMRERERRERKRIAGETPAKADPC